MTILLQIQKEMTWSQCKANPKLFQSMITSLKAVKVITPKTTLEVISISPLKKTSNGGIESKAIKSLISLKCWYLIPYPISHIYEGHFWGSVDRMYIDLGLHSFTYRTVGGCFNFSQSNDNIICAIK